MLRMSRQPEKVIRVDLQRQFNQQLLYSRYREEAKFAIYVYLVVSEIPNRIKGLRAGVYMSL